MIKLKQFNTWERYFDPTHPKYKYQVVRHAWFMDRVKGESFLDVGCSGGLALFLAGKNENVKKLCGIDIDSISLKMAEDRLLKYKNKEVILKVSDVSNIPFDSNSFDTVLCGETLEHVTDDCKVIKEIVRVSKPGATILISVPKDGHLSRQHVRLYNRKKLNQLTNGAGLTIIEESEMKASKNGYYLLSNLVK